MTPPDGDPPRAEPNLVVANEFAAVAIRKVHTRNGERLEIRSLQHEHSVRLDALALEALTWSDALEVGKGLETPLGPEGGDISPTGPAGDADQ